MTGKISKYRALFVVIVLLSGLLSGNSDLLHAQRSDTIAYYLHEVKPKETVYSISTHAGIQVEDVYRLNPRSKEGIRIGEKLRIPLYGAHDTSFVAKTDSLTGKKIPRDGIHVVQSGETFYAISRKYNISPAILKQYNPDIDPDVISPGMEIRISLADGTKLNEAQGIVVSAANQGTVKVGLLLPVDLSSGTPSRFIHFYEGFLLGVYRAKKSGISVELNVYTTPDESSFSHLLHSGDLADRDVIFGGQTSSQVADLSRYTTDRGIVYVSPFITTPPDKVEASSNVFKLNPEQSSLYPYVVAAFRSQFRDYYPIFVTTSAHGQQALVKTLEEDLSQHHITFSRLPLDGVAMHAIKSRVGTKKALFILDDSRRETLYDLRKRFEEAGLTPKDATIFGFPEWQSFDKEILLWLGTYHATIYSSFFFDRKDPSTVNYVQNYRGWYSKPLDGTYPKFSILGYDAANYFLGALAHFGPSFINMPAQVPGDGLQSHFIFRKVKGDEAFSNVNLFFVTYDERGEAKRMKVVY